LIVWSAEATNQEVGGISDTTQQEPLKPIFDADQLYDAGDQGCATGPMDLGAWCRMTGNELVDHRGHHFLVRKK
jgi:hypothetical protein